MVKPEIKAVAAERCSECGKKFSGKAARYNKDIHMRFIHPDFPWVPAPTNLKSKNRKKSKKGLSTGYISEESTIVALGLLDITRSISVTAECTGIPEDVLEKWQETPKSRKRSDTSIVAKTERVVESMLMIILMRSSKYTPEQLVKITTTLCAAIPGLRARPMSRLRKVTHTQPAEPQPEASPEPVAGVTTAQQWHDLIESIYLDSQNSDAPLSRREIIDSLIQQRSEARDVLEAIRAKLTEQDPIESHSVS